jgi:hypothetical protein
VNSIKHLKKLTPSSLNLFRKIEEGTLLNSFSDERQENYRPKCLKNIGAKPYQNNSKLDYI